MIKNHVKHIVTDCTSWVQKNAEEALLCLFALVIAVIFATVGAFYFGLRGPEATPPEPLKASKGWVFQSREAAGGGQVCDVYTRGSITQVRCYGQEQNGKWVLKNVF